MRAASIVDVGLAIVGTGCTLASLVMVGCLLGVLVGRWRRRHSGCSDDDDDDDDCKTAETRRIVSRSDAAAAAASTSSSWLRRVIRRATRTGGATAQRDRCAHALVDEIKNIAALMIESRRYLLRVVTV